MPISREDILRIATLARLDLTEDELSRLENDLARILENIDCTLRVKSRLDPANRPGCSGSQRPARRRDG